MVILKFLLIVFVIFYVLMLLGRLYLRRFIRKNQEHFNNQGKKQKDSRSGRGHKKGGTYVQYKPNEKKNIPEDEGEYIDYEEIK